MGRKKRSSRNSRLDTLIVHKHVLPPESHPANPYPAPKELLEDRPGYPWQVPPWERQRAWT